MLAGDWLRGGGVTPRQVVLTPGHCQVVAVRRAMLIVTRAGVGVGPLLVEGTLASFSCVGKACTLL